MKYILVTGGVISGIGKGIVTSSIGALLKACNIEITAIKIDPYINIDAGTFSPYEHGEVYVLNDGCEVDLDLGNYERFLDVELNEVNNITTGKIYQSVINRERQGDYLGKTVQIIPHITNSIQEWIERAANANKKAEVCIIELGGTIGDIEGMPFVHALEQLRRRVKNNNFCCCHVNLVPCIGPSSELKTKPTQVSVSQLKCLGLQPDMIFCRSEIEVTKAVKEKISYFCGVELNRIFSLPNLKSIYKVPILLEQQGIIKALSESLNVKFCPCDRLKKWTDISEIALHAENEIKIALVGKYTASHDCYTSVVKSLEHACYSIGARPIIRYIDSDSLETSKDNQAWTDLKSSSCILVPGGFGLRGIEGKIVAINWARQNKIPYLGICLGFQLAVIEYARNVLLIKDAHSNEFLAELKKEKGILDIEPFIIEMLEYNPKNKMGGTMRLGLRPTKFVTEDSILRRLYNGKGVVEERHRHRYEVNPDHIDKLEKAGLRFVGKSSDETRMEILELDKSIHPYFVATQYHPEFLSRPFEPSPPFKGFIESANDFSKSVNR